MGLLDKANKLAATAKDRYDELRDAREAAAVAPVSPPPPDEHQRRALRRAMAHGAPDPDALLTRAEAAYVTGVALGEPRLLLEEGSVGVEFAAEGRRRDRWSVAVSAWHGDEDGFDPAGQYAFIAEHVGGAPVAGLGQAATWDGARLYVLAEPLLFHVEVRVPADGDRLADATAVARSVLARIEG